MILATNRVSSYLVESLESMAAQTYADIEVIVVDDGCPDRTSLDAVLGSYPDLVVIHQAPSGVSVARNVGVDRARGSLIGFFDDDDRYPPDWVERHVGAHLAQPGVVLTYADLRSIDDQGRDLGVDRSRQADIHDFFRREVAVLAGSMVVDRAAFVRLGGFNRIFPLAADLDLSLRLVTEGPARYIPGLVRDYRTHAGNVTRCHRELVASIDGILDLHRRAAIRCGRDDLVADLRVGRAANGRFAFWSAARVARASLASRDPAAAVREMFWAWRAAPSAPLSWLRRLVDGRGGRTVPRRIA
ncbi:glycosyltransferase [Raineyella sp. LH-20]|uniref:glycosyltransferase n=1 Tax=Raineyella sp. LH-20 TaxID=3081204 RepID=UPI0029556FE4|nr:glycosyltransferase [Raineyella sp. LH-20]WOP17208.1 glycosyltransferase [Raineyella sp. LH-20]